MHGLDRRAGKLELAARLERDRAAAGDVEQADDIAVLDDRLPAEQVLHAFEQRADAAAPVIGDRAVALDREHELLVLGADAELRLRLAARLEPRDQLVARFDRRHVDLVASHAGVPAERAATIHGGCEGGQLGHAPRTRSRAAPRHPDAWNERLARLQPSGR